MAIKYGSGKQKLVGNRHFWIITFIIVFLILLYNASFFNITNFPLVFKDISVAKGVHAIISSFLFLIPVLYSSAVFRIKGTIITWSIFMVAILPRAFIEFNNLENMLIIFLFALVTLLVSILMALDYNPLAKGDSVVVLGKTTRWHTLARLLRIRDYEKQYVVRKLHDNIIQSLLVIANRAHSLENGSFGAITPQAKRNLEKLELMLLHVIDDVRRLSRDLRPSIMDNVGLLPVLQWHTERISQESSINVTLKRKGLEYKLPPESEVIIYRIAQEACSNIVEHSGASKAEITLDFAADCFKLDIHDNGVGFTIPLDKNHFIDQGKHGIERIEQQTKLLDGSSIIISEPGKGTKLELKFPL